MLVDSHCHLDLICAAPGAPALPAVLQDAAAQGVSHLLCVAVSLTAYPAMCALVEGFEQVSMSVGVHPNEDLDGDPSVEQLIALARNQRVVAVGETGLDYYRSEGDLSWQRARFARHIDAAKALGLPLIVHTRAARDDTLAVLRAEKASAAGGVLHCFTEDWDMARAALDMGFYISFSGIVTFKNAETLRDVARKVPADRLLIETDAPYLAPMPHRGKRNEPAFVRLVAEHIAVLRGVSLTQLAHDTTENFYRLFARARPTALPC